jgi:hypothetical protein
MPESEGWDRMSTWTSQCPLPNSRYGWPRYVGVPVWPKRWSTSRNKQGQKARTVQPVTMEPSIGPEGCIGVVVHLSKTRKKRINIWSIEQTQQTRTQKRPPRQHINSDFDSDRWLSRKTRLHENGVGSGKLLNTKVIDNFVTFPESTNTPSYAQQFRS